MWQPAIAISRFHIPMRHVKLVYWNQDSMSVDVQMDLYVYLKSFFHTATFNGPIAVLHVHITGGRVWAPNVSLTELSRLQSVRRGRAMAVVSYVRACVWVFSLACAPFAVDWVCGLRTDWELRTETSLWTENLALGLWTETSLWTVDDRGRSVINNRLIYIVVSPYVA